MPSRALNTAAGQKDASGKIKSDQPETSPENDYFPLVHLFAFSWVHPSKWLPVPPCDPETGPWPVSLRPGPVDLSLSSSTLAHDWPGCHQTCSRLVVRLGFYLTTAHGCSYNGKAKRAGRGSPRAGAQRGGLAHG